MNFFWVLGFMICLASMGCQGDGQDHGGDQGDLVNEMKKEVIAMHDEVMPRMADIARLKEKLDTEMSNEALDSTLRNQVKKRIDALEEGDSLMWDWMHNFSVPETSEDSILLYLKEEKRRIDLVATKMHESIKNAEELLLKLGHGEPN